MLNTVSEEFKNAVLNGTGMLTSRLVFDGETVTEINADKIYSINYTYNTCNDVVALGSTYIPNAKIEIEKPTESLKNKYFSWEIGLSFDNGATYEYCLMRRFRVRNITISGEKATLETSSKFYDSEIVYVPPTQIMSSIAALNDISQKIGITIDVTELIDRQITVPTGKTCRELIGSIFALDGYFAWISRDDTTIYPKWYEDSVTIIDDGFSMPTTESEDVTISRVYATLPDKTLLSDGAGYGIDVTNTLLTEQIFNALSAKLKGYTYRISSFTLICGNPLLDEYDTVSLEYDGEIYNIPVTQLSHSYSGGFSTTIKAVGQTDGDSEDDYKSPVTQALDTLTAELVVANRLIAEKATITELKAANAEITRLEAEYLAANQAIIDDLTANTGRIAALEVNTLTAESAVIKQLQTEMLTANSAVIGDLQATAALFNTFSSVFGFTQNSQIVNLTAANVTIDEAVIKDIIAKKITVADLLTASAQAERIDIIKDGSASISFLGATQQFYDSEGNVRVQIGQAADGDFNFIVVGADGTTTILNADGITSAAVPDGLIVDSMVSDNAHISGGKIDMQSLIDEINGSEYKFKTSTLVYDEDGQSLNLKFTELINNIDELEETVTDHGASLEVINGQINGKIWQNDITTAVDGLQIGGRNYILDSARTRTLNNDGAGMLTLPDWFYNDSEIAESIDNQTVTVSFDYDCNITNGECQFSFYHNWNRVYLFTSADNGQGHFAVTKTLGDVTHSTSRALYLQGTFSGSISISNVKLEMGSKATDWTPAPEDMATASELSSKYSEVNQTIDSITSTVSSMQSDVSGVQTQLAEFSQDLSGFKTTVSKTYATNDSLNGAMGYAMSQISSAQSEISQQADQIALKVSKDGVISAINQSAEEITIDASKIDLSGYVTFTAHQGAISGLSNAISSVASTANSAKAWTDENGTNMTALRSMVMKWTNNAVSTSTYIQGGWIATNTITAEKIAIGLSGNILLYSLDTFEMVASSTIAGLKTSHITSIGYDRTYKRYGDHSLKVVTDGATLCYVRLENSDIANDGIMPVAPDEYYVFSWYVRSTSHDSINMQGYVWKYDDDMETQTGGFALTKRTLTGCKSGWVRYISAPFKPSCNYMVLAIYTEDATTAVTEYIDCLQLEQVENTLQTASPWKPNQATVIDGGTIWVNTIQSNSIAAGAITANKIAAKAVTADKISVASLQAVSANIGGFKISSNNLISANSSSFTYNGSAVYYLRTMLSPTGFGIMFDGEYSTTTGAHGYDGYRLKIEGLTQVSTPYESAITVTGPGMCYIRSRSVGGTITNLMRFTGSDAYRANAALQYIYVYKPAYFASTISCSTLTERSDERLKTDINDISDKYITLFDCLTPRTFRFKDDPTKLHTGFIAQELLSAIDKSGLTADEVGAFVDVNKDGSEYHIAYTELTAILTAKIKQLENKIKNLEVQINENNSN